MSEFAEKVRSIAAPRRTGQSERRVEKVDGRITAITTEHWDGRVDAIARPDVIRYGARVHTGKRKGQTAEVRQMTPKDAKERYGA